MTTPPKDILEDWKLWGLDEPPRDTKIIRGGLTNSNFLIDCVPEPLLLRLNNNERSLGIERATESDIHKLLFKHGLAPAIRYTAPNFRYWVREYIPGDSLREVDISDQILRNMVTILDKVHTLPPPVETPRLNVKARCLSYLNAIANPNDRYCPDLETLFTAVDNLPSLPESESCLCHMDPLPANWLRDNNDKLWLLDWEYACIAHPSIDFAAITMHFPQTARQTWTTLLPESVTEHLDAATEQVALLDRTWRLAHETSQPQS